MGCLRCRTCLECNPSNFGFGEATLDGVAAALGGVSDNSLDSDLTRMIEQDEGDPDDEQGPDVAIGAYARGVGSTKRRGQGGEGGEAPPLRALASAGALASPFPAGPPRAFPAVHAGARIRQFTQALIVADSVSRGAPEGVGRGAGQRGSMLHGAESSCSRMGFEKPDTLEDLMSHGLDPSLSSIDADKLLQRDSSLLQSLDPREESLSHLLFAQPVAAASSTSRRRSKRANGAGSRPLDDAQKHPAAHNSGGGGSCEVPRDTDGSGALPRGATSSGGGMPPIAGQPSKPPEPPEPPALVPCAECKRLSNLCDRRGKKQRRIRPTLLSKAIDRDRYPMRLVSLQ